MLMPKFCANLSLMFTELPFLDRFEAAARAGFRGVEYLFPYEFDAADIKARLDEHGLTQVLFNMPPGDWAGGERGIAIFAERQQEFRDGVGKAVAYAKALGCRQVHALAGILPPSGDPDEAERIYVDNLRHAAEALAQHDLDLLIEPINTRDIPGYFLRRTGQALRIIETVGADNLFLQYDCYHMQIMEGDLCPSLQFLLPSIRHVQVADTPGRHEPGTGEINYPFVFAHLDSIGYDGWVGCEYRPLGATSDGLAWFAPYAANR
jgi:hydroxypyruvate isomerase